MDSLIFELQIVLIFNYFRPQMYAIVPFQARKLSLLETAGVFDKLYEDQ